MTWGVPLLVSSHFAFSCCSWGSQGKNTEVACHSLFQWTTFCQISLLWPSHFGWPHMAWLGFIELDKAAVCVIRLTSFLWLWFQCVCPLATSTIYLGFSYLNVWYLFTSAPAKHSRCSLPWTRQIWKTQQWPQDWKRSVFIPISKKDNAKERSNYRTIALISHAQNSPSQASAVCEPWTSRCSSWF